MDNNHLKNELRSMAETILKMEQGLKRLDLFELEILSVKANFQKQIQSVRKSISALLNEKSADNTFNKYMDWYPTYHEPLQQFNPSIFSTVLDNNFGHGFDNQYNHSSEKIIKEIKAMIIELKIKGSVRERANGLIEFRSTVFGSIYGRTKEAIEEQLRKKLKDLKTGKLNKPKKQEIPLFSVFCEESYLPYKQANLADKTLRDMRNYIKFIIASGLDKPLNNFTAAEIEKFLYSIPQTRKRQLMRGLFNNIFNYAKRLGKIKHNPCDNVEKMKHNKEIGCALSFKTQYAFFNALFSPESKNSQMGKYYLTFVYLTGARREEAINLTVDDVDFENNVLRLPGTKTKGSDRYIPLFPLVKKLLQKIMPEKGKVFKLTYDQADTEVRRLGRERHIHELRHTFGTIQVCVQKLDIKTVSLYMGHSTINMTLSTYTHPEQLDKALFFNGSLSEEEKLLRLREEYQQVLDQISSFLD